jgi:hypothetical protein
MKLLINSIVQCLNISKFNEIPIRMNNNGITFFSSLLFIYQAVQCLVRGGQINQLSINRPITDVNQTDITVIDSYRSVIG